MKLYELLACSSAQWLGHSFTRNPLFNVKLIFENQVFGGIYNLDFNYFNDENYLSKYRDRVVQFWYIIDANSFVVQIEGSY